MRNLASREYNPELDSLVKEELKEAGVGVIRVGVINNEVKTHYIGILNNFIFERAWTYWVVKGYMPLEYAEQLYSTSKDLLIRAGGDCGNEEPYTQAKSKCSSEIAKKWLEAYRRGEINMKEADERYKEEDRKLPQFVTVYHVDTQQGLIALANFIKEHNIITEIYQE